MKWRCVFRVSSLFLAVVVSNLPALAQLGVGFGIWGGGGHNTGYGGWFGTSLWPYRTRSAIPSRPSEKNRETNGYLEGVLTLRTVCPDSQPKVACPVLSTPLSDIAISAEPYGANQWITSHPDANGHFRLILPPGGYNLRIHHPDVTGNDEIVRQIIIQPGKTSWQNFQIDQPLQ